METILHHKSTYVGRENEATHPGILLRCAIGVLAGVQRKGKFSLLILLVVLLDLGQPFQKNSLPKSILLRIGVGFVVLGLVEIYLYNHYLLIVSKF